MGRFSRRLAPLFADFAGVSSDDHVLDVGAGTGALTEELLRRGATVSLAEPSPDFAASLQRRLPDLDVRAAPAEQLPWPDGSFDVALAQLVVAFMSDAWTGVAEMKRVSGGRTAICMWDYHEQQLLASVNHVRARMGGAARPSRRGSAPAPSSPSCSATARRSSRSTSSPTTRVSRTTGMRCSAAPARPARGSRRSRRGPRGSPRRAEARARRPGRPVHALGPRLGGPRQPRLRTDSRSAPVPTRLTATPSSRSTNST